MKIISKGSFVFIGFLLIILGLFMYFDQDIAKFYVSIIRKNTTVELNYKNEYYNNYEYDFVRNTSSFKSFNHNDLFNIYYTIINSGVDEFSFYCPDEYEKCISDISVLADNQKILSNINGFIHPFNSFATINTTYDNFGKVTVKVKKTYSESDIEQINKKVNYIIANVVRNKKDKKEIIKLVHDYIIDNTKYDSLRSDSNIAKYASNTAYGPLVEGYGICGGYTDAMAIFLNYYQIPNFKVVSENHIWNAVNLDGKWYHLDLTWDDPITDNGENIIDYNYFLITTKQLEKLNDNEHNYDKNTFKELA